MKEFTMLPIGVFIMFDSGLADASDAASEEDAKQKAAVQVALTAESDSDDSASSEVIAAWKSFEFLFSTFQ